MNRGYEVYRDGLDVAFPDVDDGGADMTQDNSGRSFVWARLQDKITGRKILAICTHLHYRNSDNPDDEFNTPSNVLVRQYEIRLLLAWVEAQTFDYDAVVILGDMNADYLASGAPTIKLFRDGGYAVTRDSAKIKGDIDGTLDGWNPDTQTARGKRKTDYYYDYILTKGYVDTAYYTVVDNKIDNGNTSYPSDHLPILTNLIVY